MNRIAQCCTLAAVLVTGCSSTPSTILESDVPVPPAMVVRYSTDIRRDAGTLSGGNFLLSGAVKDTKAAAEATVVRFTENGWRETRREIQPSLAILEFIKDHRSCRVEIDARRVDPRMSSAVMRIAVAQAPAGG